MSYHTPLFHCISRYTPWYKCTHFACSLSQAEYRNVHLVQHKSNASFVSLYKLTSTCHPQLLSVVRHFDRCRPITVYSSYRHSVYAIGTASPSLLYTLIMRANETPFLSLVMKLHIIFVHNINAIDYNQSEPRDTTRSTHASGISAPPFAFILSCFSSTLSLLINSCLVPSRPRGPLILAAKSNNVPLPSYCAISL